MRQKHLESALSSVQRDFPEPKVQLEQYSTSPHLTALVILMALERDDVGPGRTALDLGCGTGMLSLGAALVGTDFVWALDCDETALHVMAANVRELELEGVVETVHVKVTAVELGGRAPARPGNGGRGSRGRGRGRSSAGRCGSGTHGKPARQSSEPSTTLPSYPFDDNLSSRLPLAPKIVDTVLTNPPFGTKHNAGMDVRFLQTACTLARRCVYSFHKTSTRAFVLKTIAAGNLTCEVVAEMKFDLPAVYRFHQEKSRDVAVDLIRVSL